jgi:hypothetical protein
VAKTKPCIPHLLEIKDTGNQRGRERIASKGAYTVKTINIISQW